MSKSAIYTANTSAQTVAVNDIIPVGTTSRRFGCNIRQDGNTITLLGQGYCTVTLTGQKDGVAVIGATASQAVATAAAPTNLALTFLVRNACGCESSILSFLLTGTAAAVNNMAVAVEKL